MEEEDSIDEELQEVNDKEALDKAELMERLAKFNFVLKVKRYLLQYYTTADNPIKAKYHFTTQEVWEQLQQLFPSLFYSQEDVATWLNEGGFKFYDFGCMRFEWLVNKL